MGRTRRKSGITSGGRKPARSVATSLGSFALLVGACGGEQASQHTNREPSTTATAAPSQAEPSVPSPSSSLPPTAPTSAPPRPTPPSTVPVGRQPVYKDGLPQVTTTPSRAMVGGTVRFSGTGFTDSMWRSGETLWLVGTSEGGCSLYAQAEGSRVTLRAGGLLEGELVVPPSGVCRQNQPLQLADIAPGHYRLAYGCTPCFIGELTIFEPALTAHSRLRADGVGPLRIGMTLDEAKQAAGTPLDTVALVGCVELVPTDASISIGLWSHDGRTLDVISGGADSALTTRAGIRAGSPVEAVEQAYTPLVRNTDESTFLVVAAGDGLALAFEILGGQVRNLFAGEQQRIEYGAHCP